MFEIIEKIRNLLVFCKENWKLLFFLIALVISLACGLNYYKTEILPNKVHETLS